MKRRLPGCGALLIAIACVGAARAETKPSIRLSKEKNVEVVGLRDGTLQQLKRVEWSAERWTQLLAVYVDPPDSDFSDDAPAMLGSHEIRDGMLTFLPRYPLVKGTRYRVVLQPSQLPSADTDLKPITQHVLIPKPSTKPTEVRAVFPTSDEIPANLLKFYVHFSAPMSQKNSYYHVELLDPDGKPVKLPFLELAEELWSPDGKRITLYIDPGRVKRGVKPLVDLGPAFVAGKKQTLVIHASWLDANGNRLKSSVRKTFTVVDADRSCPLINEWKIDPPAAKTTQPLNVRFDEPLEHALAERMISVLGPDGRRIDGKTRLSDNETSWHFVPKQRWKPGKYRLIVDGQLEDLAGNSMVKPFETELTDDKPRPQRPKTVQRSFYVR